MTIDSILSQIDAEIAKLTQVRSLLANTGKVSATVTERVTKKVRKTKKAKKVAKAVKAAPVAKAAKGKRQRLDGRKPGRSVCLVLRRASGSPMRSASAGQRRRPSNKALPVGVSYPHCAARQTAELRRTIAPRSPACAAQSSLLWPSECLRVPFPSF